MYLRVCGFLIALSTQAFADNVAIIGGIDLTGAPPYAALVSSSGGLTPLALGDASTVSGSIQSVAMNSSGVSLVGGLEQETGGSTPAYAAIVSPTGGVTPIVIGGLLEQHGVINSVAINNFGNGIIGGRDTTGPIFAALVPPSGNPITPLVFPPLVAAGGIINSVSINDAGTSLIGGRAFYDAFPAYAALVSPSGAVNSLTLTGGIGISGQISSVSINPSGNGLIGGQDLTGSQPAYAAIVSSGGAVTPLSLSGGIATTGQILSVAINGFGSGLIGGQDQSGSQPTGYAALVFSGGAVVPLALTGGVTTNGVINTVAINSSGNGIIGGQDLNDSQPAYAALVSSSGSVTPLALGPDMSVNGIINSVAINSEGNGILGGWDLIGTQPAYAALFTSSGRVIPLTFTGGMAITGSINSVALPLFNRIPTDSLSGNNLIFANYINEFASDKAFYFIPAVFDGTLDPALQSAAPTRNGISIYTASNNLFFLTTSFATHIRNQQQNRWLSCECPCDEPFSIWFDAFGAWAHQSAQEQTIGFDPTTGGAILAFDGLLLPQLRLGGGVTYLFTDIREKQNQGYSHIHQEDAFVYGSWDHQACYVDLLVLGGALQIDQVRNTTLTGFSFRSSSHPNGWQLLSHVELGCRGNCLFNQFGSNHFFLNPFVMLDWANAWQESYQEKGDSPFNAAQTSYYGSLLRTEIGLRFYETLFFNCWNLTFQEKIGYVNTQSFNAGRVNAFLVGSPGSFTVETLSCAQSLGVGQIAMIFDPINRCYPTTTLFYQGQFGRKYQSHQLNLELAWQF